jgi:glycerophosphoryl diester phosphodiesterase
VIAHRGASWDERENTLPAFERAIASGADFVELDVQVSADGVLVVFHDLDLDRLTPLRGPMRRRPAAELREHGIPTLDEVLQLTRGRVGVMAELKSAHLFRRHDVIARTVASLGDGDVVVSFGRRALLEARRRRPGLRLVQHVGYGVSIRVASRYAWAVGFHDPRVTPRGIARARALGLETTVYTVNDERRMRELVALGVGGIFSDRPALLRDVVSSPGRPPARSLPRGSGASPSPTGSGG